MSENYLGIITENYQWELSSENYDLVITLHDYHMEKLRFIVILAYPKTIYNIFFWLRFCFANAINDY